MQHRNSAVAGGRGATVFAGNGRRRRACAHSLVLPQLTQNGKGYAAHSRWEREQSGECVRRVLDNRLLASPRCDEIRIHGADREYRTVEAGNP